MFQHYIITRFNLRQKGWVTAKNNTAVLSEEWIENRFRIFELYCLPTLKAQTNPNFKWLIFFDTNTPDFYAEKIGNYVRDFPNLVPVFVDGMDAFSPEIRKILAEDKNPYLITTRLDNDDAVSINFVDEIQKQFDQQTYEAIDFVDGYTLQIHPNFRMGKRKHLYNPFISLIEKNENPVSVTSKGHTLWKKEKRVKRVENNRIWMSIIHFENKVNEFEGYGEVDINKVMEEFAFSHTLKLEIKTNSEPCGKWVLVNMKNMLNSYFTVYFKDLKRKLKVYS